MSTLTITKNYLDTDILYEADLDKFKTDVETFFNTTGITEDNLQINSITASSKLDNSAITTIKIQDNAVTEAKLETGSPTTGISTTNINNDAITTIKIQDSAITNSKLAGSITHDKIATNTIDDTQLMPAKNITTSASPITFDTSSLVAVDSGITVTSMTLSGQSRPVLIQLWGGSIAGTSAGTSYLYLYRNNSAIYKIQISNASNIQTLSRNPSSAFTFLDIGASGSSITYTIYLQGDGTNAIIATTVSMTCMEL